MAKWANSNTGPPLPNCNVRGDFQLEQTRRLLPGDPAATEQENESEFGFALCAIFFVNSKATILRRKPAG